MRQVTAEMVCSILDCLERAAVDVWLDGGWGVDALLGAQTRPHGDLDVIVSQRDVPRLCEALGLSAGWVRSLIKRWNAEGPDGLVDRRKRTNGGREKLTAPSLDSPASCSLE